MFKMRANRRLSIRELAEECGILVGSCYEILTAKLKVHRVAAVSRLITDDQKANIVRVCQELLDLSDEHENVLSRIIIVYGYDVETKVQSSQWVGQTSPRPKQARQVQSNVKVMLTVFFGCEECCSPRVPSSRLHGQPDLLL